MVKLMLERGAELESKDECTMRSLNYYRSSTLANPPFGMIQDPMPAVKTNVKRKTGFYVIIAALFV
jgi:hypothetical protein